MNQRCYFNNTVSTVIDCFAATIYSVFFIHCMAFCLYYIIVSFFNIVNVHIFSQDVTATKNGEEQNGQNKETTVESKTEETPDAELNKKIVTQIEYYFGNFNLPRDKFLSAEVSQL